MGPLNVYYHVLFHCLWFEFYFRCLPRSPNLGAIAQSVIITSYNIIKGKDTLNCKYMPNVLMFSEVAPNSFGKNWVSWGQLGFLAEAIESQANDLNYFVEIL